MPFGLADLVGLLGLGHLGRRPISGRRGTSGKLWPGKATSLISWSTTMAWSRCTEHGTCLPPVVGGCGSLFKGILGAGKRQKQRNILILPSLIFKVNTDIERNF